MEDDKTMAERLNEDELEIQAQIFDVAHVARDVDLGEYIEKVSLYLETLPKDAPEELVFPVRVSLRMARGLREFQKTFPTDEEMAKLAETLNKNLGLQTAGDLIDALRGD